MAAERSQPSIAKYLETLSALDAKLPNNRAPTQNELEPIMQHLQDGLDQLQKLKPDTLSQIPKAQLSQYLIIAARHGHLDSVQFLAGKAGADVHTTDTQKRTALHRAVNAGHAKVVLYLLTQTAGPHNLFPPNCAGTILHRAITFRHKQVAAALIQCHIELNTPDLYEYTPIMRAIDTQDRETALLLVVQADVSIPNDPHWLGKLRPEQKQIYEAVVQTAAIRDQQKQGIEEQDKVIGETRATLEQALATHSKPMHPELSSTLEQYDELLKDYRHHNQSPAYGDCLAQMQKDTLEMMQQALHNMALKPASPLAVSAHAMAAKNGPAILSPQARAAAEDSLAIAYGKPIQTTNPAAHG